MDLSARNQIVEQSIGMIAAAAKRACRGHRDWPEMVPVATAAFIKAIDKHDPKHNVRPTTFASRCAYNAVVDELRSHNSIVRVPRQRKGGKKYAQQAERAMRPVHPLRLTRPARDDGTAQVDVDDVLSRLPPRLAYILRRRMEGDKSREIGESLGMSQSVESNLKNEAARLAMRAMR